MKKKILFIIFVFVIVPAMVLGQLKNQHNPVNVKQEIVKTSNDNFLGLSFIDPSKIRMSHSYSISYFSIGGRSISQSLYLNTINYQISNPLSLKLQWGILNYPHNSLIKDNPVFRNGLIFSGAELKYKPSDKFLLKFQYNALPGFGSYRYYPHTIFLDDEE